MGRKEKNFKLILFQDCIALMSSDLPDLRTKLNLRPYLQQISTYLQKLMFSIKDPILEQWKSKSHKGCVWNAWGNNLLWTIGLEPINRCPYILHCTLPVKTIHQMLCFCNLQANLPTVQTEFKKIKHITTVRNQRKRA